MSSPGALGAGGQLAWAEMRSNDAAVEKHIIDVLTELKDARAGKGRRSADVSRAASVVTSIRTGQR